MSSLDTRGFTCWRPCPASMMVGELDEDFNLSILKRIIIMSILSERNFTCLATLANTYNYLNAHLNMISIIENICYSTCAMYTHNMSLTS